MSQQDWVIVSSCIALVLVVAVWLVLRKVLADDEELGPEHRSAAEVASVTAAAVAAGARGAGRLLPRGGRAIGRGCRKLAHVAGAAGSALAGVVRAMGRGTAWTGRGIGSRATRAAAAVTRAVTVGRRSRGDRPAPVSSPPPRAPAPPLPRAEPQEPPAPPPPPVVAPPVVSAATPRGTPRPPERGRRRPAPALRLRRLAGGVIVLAVAGIVAAAGWGYHNLANELDASNNRVDPAVEQQLASSGSMASDSQVTAITATGVSGGQLGVSAVLVATRPGHDQMATLSVPRFTGIRTPGRTETQTLNSIYQKGGIPAAVRAVSRALHTPINHIVSIRPTRVSALVDGLGGITLVNPTELTIPPQGGDPGGHFVKGRIHLNGAQAAVYMRSGLVDDATDDRAQSARQARVLGAIVNQMLGVPVSQAPDAAAAMLHDTTSDLSQGDVLGLVWLRSHTSSVNQCAVRPQGQLAALVTGNPGSAFVNGTPSPSCHERTLAASPLAVPDSLAGVPMWTLILGVVTALVALVAIGGGVLLIRRPSGSPEPPPNPAPQRPAATPTVGGPPIGDPQRPWQAGVASPDPPAQVHPTDEQSGATSP
jgi:LCP family protein required for cell wall assembly